MNGSWLPVHCLVTETCHEFGELMLLVLSEEVSRQAEMRHAEDMKTREEKVSTIYTGISCLSRAQPVVSPFRLLS